jgi:hypothetical protein
VGLFYSGGYMPIKEEEKKEATEENKEDLSKKETKEEEKELTPDQIFEQSFAEIADKKEETEEKTTEETEEKEDLKKEEKTTEEEKKTSTEEETIEDKTKAEVKSEEKTQQETEHKEEEPPAKAPPKEKAKEEPKKEVKEKEQEKATEETKEFDASVLFEDLEKDVTDPELKKELVEFAESMDTNAKYANTIATIVGKRIVAYTNQSFKTLIDKLTPYLNATVKQIEKEHASSVRERHQDFDDLKNNEDVEVWIKEQPTYLQKAMMETYKKGEAEEVIDLLNRYKKDRGLVKQAEKKVEEEDPAKANQKKKVKEKIDNLSVVKSKDRPVHLQQEVTDQEDFEGTFDKIASSKH